MSSSTVDMQVANAPAHNIQESGVTSNFVTSDVLGQFGPLSEMEHNLAMKESIDLKGDFSNWRNKAYFGGYRNTRTSTNHYHSSTQTRLQPPTITLMFHRDSQTVTTANFVSQTRVDASCQMTTTNVHISSSNDRLLSPKAYTTTDELESIYIKNATIIQCFYRCWRAKKILTKLRLVDHLAHLAEQLKVRQRSEQYQLNLQNDKSRRLHPQTSADFHLLYSSLLVWHDNQADQILLLPLADRKAAKIQLLHQETTLLQKIDRLKAKAFHTHLLTSTLKFLKVHSAPLKWRMKHKNILIHVKTDQTIRCDELTNLYIALSATNLDIKTRLQVLLHVKFTVSEFSGEISKDIIGLVEREADLMARGREEHSITGLRSRLKHLFLRFIQTIEYNPAIATKNGSAFSVCNGCGEVKKLIRFYLSVKMIKIDKCGKCIERFQMTTNCIDESLYTSFLVYVLAVDSSKLQKGKSEMTFLQESDIKYLVDVIWHRSSIVSSVLTLDALTFTRWKKYEMLSPWNCILMTRDEALLHDQLETFETYSDEFCSSVESRLLLGKRRFGNSKAFLSVVE